ncbi:hypothetical protein BGZ95_008755, partial [Linnemannia exigua]
LLEDDDFDMDDGSEEENEEGWDEEKWDDDEEEDVEKGGGSNVLNSIYCEKLTHNNEDGDDIPEDEDALWSASAQNGMQGLG